MVVEARISRPPVMPTATLEQAIRWIAYGRPPLSERDERLEGYPGVLQYLWSEDLHLPPDSPAFYEGQDIWDAYALLLRSLAYGDLAARADRYENDWVRQVNGDAVLLDGHPIHQTERTEWNATVPSDAWDVLNVHWMDGTRVDAAAPAVSGPMVTYEGAYYAELKVQTDDLMRVFPLRSTAAQAEHDQAEALPERPDCEPAKGRPPKVPREIWLERLAVLALAGKIDRDTSQEAVAEILVDDLRRLGLDNGLKPTTLRRDERGPCSLLRGAKELAAGK